MAHSKHIRVSRERSPISNGQTTVAENEKDQPKQPLERKKVGLYVGQRLDFCFNKFDMGFSDMGGQLDTKTGLKFCDTGALVDEGERGGETCEDGLRVSDKEAFRYMPHLRYLFGPCDYRFWTSTGAVDSYRLNETLHSESPSNL